MKGSDISLVEHLCKRVHQLQNKYSESFWYVKRFC
jgi:hypothetical protein